MIWQPKGPPSLFFTPVSLCGTPFTCLCWRAACTEGRFSICWASRRLRALAMCCCCIVARMLTAVGCLFFIMFVNLVEHDPRNEEQGEGERETEGTGEEEKGGGGRRKRGFEIKSFHTHTMDAAAGLNLQQFSECPFFLF